MKINYTFEVPVKFRVTDIHEDIKGKCYIVIGTVFKEYANAIVRVTLQEAELLKYKEVK